MLTGCGWGGRSQIDKKRVCCCGSASGSGCGKWEGGPRLDDDDDYWHQGGRQGGGREARKSMDSLGARGPESVGPMFSRCGREQQGT